MALGRPGTRPPLAWDDFESLPFPTAQNLREFHGDGVVDQMDLSQFRSAFNSAAGNSLYLSYLDADNSGSVDQVDLGQFRSRFNANVY
jgi:hypothetical protein